MINQKLALQILILSIVPVSRGGSLRHRNRLHEINEHIHPEAFNELLGNVDLLLPGNPLGQTGSLEYGAPCIKINPKACKGFPEIGCVWVEGNTYVCRCDFLHTWNDTTGLCVPNVFAPCAFQASPINETIECGLNMECVSDFMAKGRTAKICRCKKGFKIAYDEEGLPAYCITDPQFVEDEEKDELQINKSFINTLDQFLMMLLLYLYTIYIHELVK
ncbi:hypothetical protein Ocin01_00345 [Orchesella cincta]|uniref:EGF-like domain-containing protein n=1 Tax=Orchesella cincta TaxID=48709 RepID=A0A1D2NLZ4_ORCCI|nr:hypothetical protein Ocin01_00345 [Orchesella cincta]